MAARLNPKHQASVKEKIKASQLINRLQNHAFGKLELTPQQSSDIRYLLDQSIGKAPQSVQMQADGNITLKWK